MNKYGRIPSIPLEASKKEKAIAGEILVNWDGLYLMGKHPITGETVRLGDSDSLLGTVNYIANTNFDMVPNNFRPINGIELSTSEKTGYYNSNELHLACSEDPNIYVESEYKIYKNKNYTLTFCAKCNKNTVMHIKFDEENVFDIVINKSNSSKYKIIINTNNFERSFYNGFYLSFDYGNLDIYLSQFMFEYGATANPWTDRTEITSVKIGDLNVNGILSINGVDVMSILSGDGTKGSTSTANDIVTQPAFISNQTEDSNYDIIDFTGNENEDTVIAYKGFNGLLYGTYSIMIRMKSSNINGSLPIATVNVYEYTNKDGNRLLSSSPIYPSHFNNKDEFEELGIVTKYNGTSSDDTDRMIAVEVIAHGDGNTNIKIDYIYISMAYTSLLPVKTIYS